MAYDYYYSPSMRGFYIKEIHGEENIPPDAVGPISQEAHILLINGQNSEIEIRPNLVTGFPELVDRIFTHDQLLQAMRYFGKVMAHEAAVSQGFVTFDEAIRNAPLGDGDPNGKISLRFLRWGNVLAAAIQSLLIDGKTDAEMLAFKKDRAGTMAMLPQFADAP